MGSLRKTVCRRESGFKQMPDTKPVPESISVALSFNGRTAASQAVDRGSIPRRATKFERATLMCADAGLASREG